MDPVLLVTLTLVGASVVLGFYTVYMMGQIRMMNAEIDQRRRLLGVDPEAEQGEDNDAQEEVSDIIRDQAADVILAYLGEYGERLQILVKASGQDTTVSEVVKKMAMFAIGGLMFSAVVLGPGKSFLGLMLGYLPYQRLSSAANKRASDLTAQMPDALELMSRAMQTGTGLSEAFRLVSEEMSEPIGLEFGRIYEEVKFGKDWRETFNGLIDRNPTIFELRLFVSSMLLQREAGGNMIETLANIARTIRGRYVFDAKVKAMTSEARASGTILALMPLGVIGLILVANPEYLTPLVNTSLGQAITLMCACLYGFGIYLMQMVVQVEV